MPNYYSRYDKAVPNVAALSNILTTTLRPGTDVWVQSPLSLYVWTGTQWQLQLQAHTRGNILFTFPSSSALGSFTLNCPYAYEPDIGRVHIKILPNPSSNSTVLTSGIITATMANTLPFPSYLETFTMLTYNTIGITQQTLTDAVSKCQLDTNGNLSISYGLGTNGLLNGNFTVNTTANGNGFRGANLIYLI